MLKNKQYVFILQDMGIDIWSRPIEPKEREFFSYAIAFVNRQTLGTPILYNITLKDLGLYNPKGYKIWVSYIIIL